MTADPIPLRPRRRGNLADAVADHIRVGILNGTMKPGTRVDQDAIAEELGVSRLPVREALITLDQEGLIENIPRRGAYVQRLEREDIIDHYQLFGQVAGLSAARAVVRLDEAGLARLIAIYEAIGATQDRAEQERLNFEFHRTINKACGSKRIDSMLRLLTRSLPMPYFEFVPEWLDEAQRQHKEIVDAFQRRDPMAAQRAMELHLNASARNAVDVLEHMNFFEEQ
jgi:DNA-binding GntR family transcriptional regulator